MRILNAIICKKRDEKDHRVKGYRVSVNVTVTQTAQKHQLGSQLRRMSGDVAVYLDAMHAFATVGTVATVT
jgi:hypothetical protein